MKLLGSRVMPRNTTEYANGLINSVELSALDAVKHQRGTQRLSTTFKLVQHDAY